MFRRSGFWIIGFLSFQCLSNAGLLSGQEERVRVIPAGALDPSGPIGKRPYEMVLADRQPERAPAVDFDSLNGWLLECEKGATGELLPSREQQLWNSPVAKLVYRGVSEESRVTLKPPEPLAIPRLVSAVTIWMYGNNWNWVPDPTTPQVTVTLLIRDSDGKIRELEITRVRWKEWWLVHKVLPQAMQADSSLSLEGIRISGCANEEDRELFFEDLTFFREDIRPLSFLPRPKRGTDLFPGQSAGANTGPGRLPFPNRQTTILPDNFEAEFSNRLEYDEGEGHFRFFYRGSDTDLEYHLKPGADYWGPVSVVMGGKTLGSVLVGAGPVFAQELQNLRLGRSWMEEESARAEWRGRLEGREIVVQSTIRLWQKSLVVDFICRGGGANELSYGYLEGVKDPELISLPFMNYGGHHLTVLMSGGEAPFFSSIWMDWYLSNSSEPYAKDEIEEGKIFLNGGVRYLPRTDGVRNDLYERFFVTFSPVFEETLANIPNPPARDGRIAGSRLWQETWGPRDYEKEIQRSRRLRAYGIEMLTQCNHEITWRDGGESFTFRTMAAPEKGGDQALRDYVAAQKKLGWRSGLYTNYTDYAPVNANWDLDMVMRRPTGDLVTAWPRCYSPKALFAVETDRKLAPLIQRKYGSSAAYTDVHTAVSPWSRTDYDARVPGAGTFAATFYAYGELLLHDQDVYDQHCWSEGHHQWLYAGLATGNYGLTYSDLKYRDYPYLPHFDLLKIHPLSVDIGIPWTARFFRDVDGWDTDENIERSIDQFLAAMIAYGHIGWLVEETHGIRQACRSYYMMQQLQSRYVMEKPERILYGTDSGLVDTSEALRNGIWRDSRLYTRYGNGLEVWVNGQSKENWEIRLNGESFRLPPYGWLAKRGKEFFEASHLIGQGRVDQVASSSYLFLDGRGTGQKFQGIATSGSVAVRILEGGDGISITTVEDAGEVLISEPGGEFGWDDVRTQVARVARASRISAEGFDVAGNRLGEAKVTRDGDQWALETKPTAVRYDVAIADW